MRALVRFEEYRQDIPDQVLAISGNPSAIPQRIERIISGKNRSLLKLEVIILLLMTILFATVSIDSSKFSAISLPSHPQQFLNHTLDYTIKKKKSTENNTRSCLAMPGITCTTCPFMHDKQICPGRTKFLRRRRGS
jgi:hypothetical protein